jgi:acyl carrier protein
MGTGIEGLWPFHAEERNVTESAPEASGVDTTLRALLADVLGLGEARAAALTDDSGLFGELPEFDSMAVATVLTEMEDRLNIVIDDDEIDGEIFETYGNLLAFSQAKVAG